MEGEHGALEVASKVDKIFGIQTLHTRTGYKCCGVKEKGMGNEFRNLPSKIAPN
jgi:hypothetical protein